MVHDAMIMSSFISRDGTTTVRVTDVVKLAINHVEPSSDVSAAVCFKTLFGEIDLGVVIQWAAYNRLLGFDRIFMFYRPEVTLLPRFHELAGLPFVSMTEQTGGDRENYYDQWITEKMCLNQQRYAASYDWAMVADIDEYLWFSESIGVKDFLRRHDNMTYLSFGKQMYTLDHRVDRAVMNHKIDTLEDGFAVSNYPFYMNHFCYRRWAHRGDPICPTWKGRAKVIVRPSVHRKVDVHGYIKHPNPVNGTVHFHPEKAHFMEWPEIFSRHNVTLRNPQNFTIRSYDEVHVHDIKPAFKPIDSNGNYLVQHDSHLKNWFDFVAGRGASRTTSGF